MFLKVRHLTKGSCATALNYAVQQYRQLGSNQKGTTRLIKAVQGSSKDELQPNYKDHRFGEDSWFVRSTPKAETLGVADGVGGWRSMGIDAGIFARELMCCCSEMAQQAEYDGCNPRQLLIDGFNRMKQQSQQIWGSSTACLVSLHRPDCTLHAANLGDSGFLVLRHGKVLHRSDEQLHGFNTPYQLSVPPASERHRVLCDEPEQAIATKLPLQQGDLVLLATDGLFDNVPENMLVQHLAKLPAQLEVEQLQLAANQLVALAKQLSQTSDFQSPFALKAQAHNRDYGIGGKPDDITVILASVEVAKE